MAAQAVIDLTALAGTEEPSGSTPPTTEAKQGI